MSFTPTESSGSVDVTFTVPAGHGGEQLVAFEWLYTGTDTEAESIAEHTDIEDAAQTVSVEELPVTATPSIGTTLLDSADGDHVLPWNGGTVIDTVDYQGLTPGTEYTLTGELHDQATGDATGITGSVTFTPTTANGSVEVSFTIPSGHAGSHLVAFESLFTGTDTSVAPIAVHHDIDDAAQTVTIERSTTTTPTTPTTPTTKPGTSTPSTPVKPTTGRGLANTGGESVAPIALAGGAALLLGAALIAVRRRRTRAGVRAE